MGPALQDRPDVAVFNEIALIDHHTRRSVGEHLPPGVTFAHYGLLAHLHRVGDGQTPAELAKDMLLSKAAMTNVLQRMEALQLVAVLADAGDRRKKRVRLTDLGGQVYAKVLRDMRWKMEALRSGFTEAEFRQALPFLRALRTFLTDLTETPEPSGASRR